MKTHIQLEKSKLNARAIVCGSPERAAWFASKLEESKPIARNREYHSFRGQFKGEDILVISHGVGSAGAAICFQELMDAGAETVIRLGTAGGFYDGVRIGDIVVPTAAVRKDGVSAQMVPIEFPAAPDLRLAHELLERFESNGVSVRSGVTLTTDLFYPGRLPTDYRLYKEANTLAVEMECSTLFVIAQLRGVRAAAALVLDGNPLSTATDAYDPSPERLAESFEQCFRAALETLVKA